MIHLTVITAILGVMGTNYAARRSNRFAAIVALLIWIGYAVLWFAFVFRAPLIRGGI